ncbi:hypothetical protein Plhal304r1_c020g0071321 [Plasmopara halstedii]
MNCIERHFARNVLVCASLASDIDVSFSCWLSAIALRSPTLDNQSHGKKLRVTPRNVAGYNENCPSVYTHLLRKTYIN